MTSSLRPGASGAANLLTLPNLISLARVAGAGGLVWLALADQPAWLLGTYLVLALSDWIDGKLANWLDCHSELGALLDTVGDVALYACLAFACLWLEAEALADLRILIFLVIDSYVLSVTVAQVKFRCWPSYHTRAAKTDWLLMQLGVACLLLGGPLWPLTLALALTLLVNLEAVVITLLLREPAHNVESVVQVLGRSKR
jgi:CDP-diacylglycerol--glycerol-3-phosphate 3-phosphatidyltransferase